MRALVVHAAGALLITLMPVSSRQAQPAPAATPAHSSIPCPMVIGLARDGSLRTNRMQSWFRTSRHLLLSDLAGGCYPEGGPRPVSSVRVLVATGTPKPTVDALLALLAQNAWPAARIQLEPWPNAPLPPRDFSR